MIALALAGSFGISIDNKLSSQLYKNKEIQYLSLDYTLFYTDFFTIAFCPMLQLSLNSLILLTCGTGTADLFWPVAAIFTWPGPQWLHSTPIKSKVKDLCAWIMLQLLSWSIMNCSEIEKECSHMFTRILQVCKYCNIDWPQVNDHCLC